MRPKNESSLNDSLSDLLSEDLSEELVVKENGHLDSLNLDSEKTSSVGGYTSVTSTSDFGREQIFTMDELVKLNLYDRLSGLVHSPETGKELPILEAIERGIVQKNSVRLCDPASGKLITLAEAFERGIMDAENGNLTDVYTGKVFKFSESVNKALEFKSCPLETNAQTTTRQEGFALCTALEKNYFDSETRCFKFPGNSKTFTLKEAVENGFIKTRSTAIRDIDFGHKIFLDTLIALGLVDQERGLFRDTQGCFVAIEKAFQDKVLVDCDISPRPYSLKVLLEDGLYSRDSNSFFDPDSKQFVSLKDAIDRNLLDPNSVLCIDHSSNNEIVSLNEAISRKFIGSDVKKNSLTLSDALDKGVALKKPIAISKAIESGLLNETTGKFLDPIHRKFFSLKEALENDFISYDSVIADPSSRNLISLSDAISSGIVDPNLGTVTNIHTQETFSLKEACTTAKLVKKKISCESSGDQNALADDVETRKSSQSSSENPSQIALNDTNTFLNKLFKRPVSLEEALKNGLIDQDSCMIALPWSDEILNMKNLIERNLIDLKSGVIKKPGNSESYIFPDVVLRESIDCNSNNFSLAEALYLEIFDPETGVVTDPNYGRKMSLFESLKSNFISYQKTVLIVDGKIVNLLEAVLNELVDPKKAEVKDVKSGQMIPLIGAIERELVLDAYMPPKFSFEKMCKLGLYDRVAGQFVNPFNKKHVNLVECLFGLEMLDANNCFIFLPDSKKHVPLMVAFNQKLLSADCNFVTDPSSRKQYPVLEALDGSLESKCAAHSVKRDDEVRNLGLLSQKLDIYKDWVSEAYQQIGTCQITANKDDLGRELRRLQNFHAMIQEVKPDMASLQNQMEKVISDSSHYHNKTKLEKLKTLNHGVKSQYNLLLENVKNQIKLLTACQEELIKYEDEKKKFETWLNTAIDELDSKFSNFKYIREVGNQKEALKNYVDEVFIRQGDLKYVEICKNQFLDQARHFDALQLKSKNLKRSSSHLDLLYSMIDDLRQLTNEYNMLRANSRAQLDRVEALSDCLKRVEDIERQVKNSLDEIEQNAEYLSKHRSKDKLRNDLVKQLKNCSSELQSQCLFFEKLKTIVNDLSRQLNQFGSTESLQKELKDKVMSLEERLRQVDDLLKAKSAELESLSFSNQSVADEVKELSSLVGSAECLVDEMEEKKMILDEELMIGRIKEMKTLGQEISVLQQPLSQLMQATTTLSSGAAIKQLHKRYRDVAAKFQRKEDELEEAIAFISGFNSITKQLKIWMNDILGHLEVKDTSVKELKEIHATIMERSEEFAKVKSNVENYLLRLDAAGGKEKLKEMVEEIQTGLTEIENLCLSRISQEEKKEELETTFKRLKDKIVFWIEDKENILNSDDKSAFGDVKSLDECIEDFQSFKDYIDELNDTCLNICELLTECDRVSSAYQRLRRYFRKGVRSPSPISFAMKHFDFEEVSGEHQRTAMELTSKYEIIGERLESERKELMESLDLLEEIRRDCQNFSEWLEKKEELFRNPSLSSDEVSHLQSCRAELLKKESSINNLKSRFQQLPQCLENTSDISRAIDDLAKRWKMVESSSAKLLEACSEQADDAALFKSLHSQLSSWLSMKEKVVAMCLGLLGVDCDVLENQSIQVELLKEEMKSEQDGYELFMDKGHKIVEHSGSEETYAYMEEISSRWNRVQTKLAEKEVAIARLLSTCTPFYQNLNSLSESISAAARLSSELTRSPNSSGMSHKDTRSKEESLEIQKAHLRNLIEVIKQSAGDVHDLVNDSSSQLKIQNKVAAAEKSFKDFLRSSDLVRKHLASRKAEVQKAMSDLGKALTWMDGILKNVASLEETTLEPSTILSLHQLFQSLKENFEAKENNIAALIKTSEDLSTEADCDDFNLRLNEVCCKFKEVRNKIVLVEPKVKLISEKANQCIADIDKLSLWLELTNSKFLSTKLNFNSKNLLSKLNDALYLKSEFDMYSVDLEMIRNVINELNSASAGAGSNMEHILVGLENVWNDSRKENEARLQILEESQEKLEELKDLQVKLDSCIEEEENNIVSQLSLHSETLEVDLDEDIQRLREILTELSTDGFLDAHELQSFEKNIEEMLKRKSGIQEKLLEFKKEHQLRLNNVEGLLREVNVIAEDQAILEDCITMNSKNNHDLSKLKQQSEYLEVFKKQNEVIQDRICVVEKNLMNLTSEKHLTNIDLIQEKVQELREESNKTLLQLGEQENIIEDSIAKLEHLDAMCTSSLNSLTDASQMLGSLECAGTSFNLEQVQTYLKDLQNNVLEKVHLDLEAIKTQKQCLMKTSPIPISDSCLDSKIVKLSDLWTSLNRKLTEEEQKLHKAFMERGNFSEALRNYSSQLLSIENEIDACDQTSLDQSHIQRQIQALNDVQDKLRVWKNGIESMEEMLSLQLNKSNSESLLNKIKLLKDNWTNLSSKTEKSKETLNELQGILARYHQKLNSFHQWLEIAENKVLVDLETIDVETSAPAMEELQLLSEEVNHYISALNECYEISKKISDVTSDDQVSTALNKNLSGLSSRLKDVAMKLNDSKDKLTKGAKLMEEFLETHHDVANLLDGFEDHQDFENCKELLASCEPKLETLKNLLQQLKGFLSPRAINEYSEIVSREEARCQKIVSQIRYKDETCKAKRDESEKLREEVEELLRSVDDFKRILSSPQKLNIDPFSLKNQLLQQKNLHDEVLLLKSKSRNIISTVRRQSRIFEVDSTLDENIGKLARDVDSCFKMSTSKVHVLEQIHPLVLQFHETLNEIKRFLDEFTMSYKSFDHSLASLQPIRQQQDDFKALKQKLVDQRFLLDRFNKTALALIRFLGTENKEEFEAVVNEVNGKFKDAKVACQNKINELDQAFYESAQMSDKIDDLCEMFESTLAEIEIADSVPSSTEKLLEHIEDVRAVKENMESKKDSVQLLRASSLEFSEQVHQGMTSSPYGSQELIEKAKHMADVYHLVMDEVDRKKKLLEKVLKSSQNFWNSQASISSEARKLEEHLEQHFNSFNETPPSNTQSLNEHLSGIQDAEETIENMFHKLSHLEQVGHELLSMVDEADRQEILSALEEMQEQLDDLRQFQNSISTDVNSQLEDLSFLKSRLNENSECLEDCEQQLNDFNKSLIDAKMAEQFLQNLYEKGHLKLNEVHGLKIRTKDLIKRRRSGGAPHLVVQVKQLKSRWLQLTNEIAKRIDFSLQSSLLNDSSKLESVLEDLYKWSDNKAESIESLPKPIKGCTLQISSIQNQLEMHKADINSHQPSIRMITSALKKGSKTDKKLKQMSLRMASIENNADQSLSKIKIKQVEIDRLLEEAKGIDEHLEVISEELERINNVARTHSNIYSRPSASIQQQHQELQTQTRSFADMEPRIDILLASQSYEVRHSKDISVASLRKTIDSVGSKKKIVCKNLEKWKKKLSNASEVYKAFEKNHAMITEWLTGLDGRVAECIPLRSTVDGCQSKISLLQSFKKELSDKKADLKRLDILALQLKNACDKTEALMVRQTMERLWQSFRNSQLKVAKLLSSYNKALKAATLLQRNCSNFVEHLHFMEQQLMESQSLKQPKNIETIKQQLKDHQNFQQQLCKKQSHYDSVQSIFKSLLDKSSSEDQQIHNENLLLIKNLWNNLCQKSAEWQQTLEELLLKRAELRERAEALIEWLSKAEPQLSDQQNLCGNLDFVTELEEEHNVFLEELSLRTSVMNAIEELYKSTQLSQNAGDNNNNSEKQAETSAGSNLIQAEILELKHKWNVVHSLAATKSEQIRLSLEKAKAFDTKAEELMTWLESCEETVEMFLPHLSDDEEVLQQHLLQIEDLEKIILEEKPEMEKFLELANEVLMQAHPSVLPDLTAWLRNFQNRCEVLNEQLSSKKSSLVSTLDEVRKSGQELEDLISWLLETEKKLRAEDEQPVLENLPIVEQLFQDFELLEAELQGKEIIFDKLMKTGRIHGGSSSVWKREVSRREGRRTPERRFKNERMSFLNDKWKQVWVLMMDRRRKLQDATDRLNKMEQLKNFDPDEWMEKFFKWMNNNFSRVINLFRKFDRKFSGKIKRSDFIQGVLNSNFTTSAVEAEIVADLFDENGFIDYKQFASNIQSSVVEESDTVKIKNEIERLSQRCCCQRKYLIVKHSEGKYKFGLSEKLRLVRIQRSCVMVRVGGGWVTLEEFLLKNDPCRAKRKVSPDCKEKFVLAEGVSQAMAPFKPKSPHFKSPHKHVSTSDLDQEVTQKLRQPSRGSRSASSTPDPI